MKGGRKVLFITIIIVVLAAILGVVFFTLFKKKDTSALAESVNDYVTTGYLKASNSASSDHNQIKSYLEKLSSTLTDNEKRNEVNNIKSAYEGYLYVADFFNREINFMEYTKYYKDNRKDVQDALKSAQKYVDGLIKRIKENNKKTSGDAYWEERAWEDVKGDMKNFLSKTIDAFNICAKIYQNSVKSNLLNNDYSDIIFLGIKNLSKDVKTKLTTEDVGDDFLKFTEKYFVEDGDGIVYAEKEIIAYQYTTEEKKNKVKDIKTNGADSSYYSTFIDGDL